MKTRERSDLQPQRRAVQVSTLVFDTRAVFQREMSLVLRDPFSVIFSLVQPLVFLALFGPLLAGSVDPAALNGASPEPSCVSGPSASCQWPFCFLSVALLLVDQR